MRIVITGASGLIGTPLVARLRADGHDVHTVSRGEQGDIRWDPDDGQLLGAAIDGAEAVIHLAGEPIDAARWSDEAKARILDSRVNGTTLVAERLAELSHKPRVLISASAIGFYGDRGDEELTEASEAGEGFLSEVVVAWERATAPAEQAGIRVVHARTGIVLSKSGGALGRMLLPFKLGIGGKIGSGQQWMSPISVQDEVNALVFLLEAEDVSGPVNLTLPSPLTNAEFTAALGEALHRPTVMPIPGIALKLLYGEMGQTLTLDSQRVLPTVLQAAGFTFEHPTIQTALAAALR